MKLIAKILLLTVLFSVVSCQDDDKSSSSTENNDNSGDRKENSEDKNDSRNRREKSADPEEVVEAVFDSYIRAISRNDWDRAAGYCYRDTRRAHQEMAAALYGLDSYYQDEFGARMEEQLANLEIISIDVNGDEATIKTEYGRGDGQDYILIKDGKDWLIEWKRSDLRDLNDIIEEMQEFAAMGDIPEEDVYYCWNGKEIPWSYVNDGACDCDDCEDEDE